MHIILFFDGSSREVSDKIAEEVMIKSCDEKLQAIKINNVLYKFGSISKIMPLNEYYQEYPDKRPQENYNQFNDIYGKIGSDQIRKPTEKAGELMKQGFIEYQLKQRKTPEQAEQKYKELMKDGVDYKLSRTISYSQYSS